MALGDYIEDEPLIFTDKDIGEYLINILTGGLYEEPHLILREYIQNSYDEIYSWDQGMKMGQIEVKLNRPNVHIYDNGPGMSRRQLKQAMSKLGISTKPYGELSGFMGIGKFAGLSMAESVRISSSRHGDPEKNWVAFDADEMLVAIEQRRSRGESRPIAETLKKHSRLNKNPGPEEADAHYTAVHLMGVKESYWKQITDRDSFLTKLGHVAPVKQNPNFVHSDVIEHILQDIAPEHYSPVQVYVDGDPLYRPFYNEVSSPRTIEIVDDDGEQFAYGWACLHTESEQIPDELLRGIALFDRGIAIGDRKLPEELGLYSSSSTIIHFRWYMGELYLTADNIQLTADRRSLRRSNNTIQFIENAKREFKKLSRHADKFSRRDNAKKKAPKQVAKIEDAENKVQNSKISRERIPHTVSEVAGAREDLKYRVKHLKGDEKDTAENAIKKADEIITQLTASPDQDSDRDEKNSKRNKDEVTISEEETYDIIAIPERLGFSNEEKGLFNLVVDTIASVSGGKDTNDFAKYYGAIEDKLINHYQN